MKNSQTISERIAAIRGKRKDLSFWPPARKTRRGPRAAKSRRPSPPEADPAATQLQSRERQIRDNIEKSLRLLDDLKKEIAACVGSKQGQHRLGGHENPRGTMKPRLTPEQYLEASAKQIHHRKIKAVASTIENEMTVPKAKEEDKTNTVEKTNSFMIRLIRSKMDGTVSTVYNIFDDYTTRLVRLKYSLMTVEQKREDAKVIDVQTKIYQEADELSTEILMSGGVQKALEKSKNKLKELQILALSYFREDKTETATATALTKCLLLPSNRLEWQRALHSSRCGLRP